MECGTDCHIAFPAETLSSRAWRNIIDSLSDHFGEVATLDEASVKPIRDYYVTHANDVLNNRAARKWRTPEV
jgi:hypothetical protein